MQFSILGDTGIQVSKLCFGTLTMSPLQKNMTVRQGAALLAYAYERGVRFLDTADLYGTYPHIREALKSAPEYVISTKAYCWDEKTASEALERAYRGVGREYIDLFMLHEQESLYTLRGHEEALNYLTRQRELGRIGAVGVSTHYAGCVAATRRFPQIQVVHPLINQRGIGIRDGSRQDMEVAIHQAHQRGVGIFAMKPLGGGHLIHDSASALQYILTQPDIDAVAMGMQSFEEIDADVAAFENAANAENLLSPLRNRTRHLMVHDWCEGCGNCEQRCPQNAIHVINGRAVPDQTRCILCGYCAQVCPQFCVKVV